MSSDPKERPVRRNIVFNVTSDHPIARIESIVGERQLVETLTGILNRYLSLLYRNPPRVTDRELCVIMDALGENWQGLPHQVHTIPGDVSPAITTDRLDPRWKIDCQQLLNRLNRSSAAERTTIAEYALAFWALAAAADPPQRTLDRIRAALQPSGSTAEAATLPRRISYLLFNETEADSGHQPQPCAEDSKSLPDTTSGAEDAEAAPGADNPDASQDSAEDQNPGNDPEIADEPA